MQMMKVSEEELKEFSQMRSVNNEHSEEGTSSQQLFQETIEADEIIRQAKEKLEQNHYNQK
jgi:hypothetical protein